MVLEILFMLLKVFVVGGSICTIAQLLINYTKITAGKILVLFLLSGVVLQAFGLYQYLVDFAGAGATVPISGFGYLLAQGAINGARESLFKAITGGVTAAGMGITAAIVFGYLISLIFKSRSKKN
jgi:stage V sporulation protein AE